MKVDVLFNFKHNRSGAIVDLKGVKLVKGYGKKIKFYRELKKISQNDIAKVLGVTDSYVSKLENEKTPMSLETLYKIAEILEVSPAALVDNKQQEPPEQLKDAGAKWIILGEKMEELNVTPELVEQWAKIVKSYTEK